MAEEAYERNKQFDLDFYRAESNYTTESKEQSSEITKLVKAKQNKLSTKAEKFLTKENEEEEAKKLDEKMQAYTRNLMKRDNVSNLFQTPKVRENEPTTATAFQPIPFVAPDKRYYFRRDNFTDYSEDLIKYRHTMR